MPELVYVRVRDCACPHTPHDDGDLVYLAPSLTVDGGILAEQQFLEAVGKGDEKLLARLWIRTFLEDGARGWNLLDEDGNPVPFDLETLLADWRLARPVADKASDLYAASVTSPFQTAPGARSPTGPTAPGTSPRRVPTSA